MFDLMTAVRIRKMSEPNCAAAVLSSMEL